ncbi:response regulator [Maridesulfovibrio sp.]|uniref:response regulator transcription factor n=1 Tax=Maridesulfovibrio sp. TaxID=2795000 RepID=UPI002A18C74D|nr:response regulator [Maridesulfovibrio sp.]
MDSLAKLLSALSSLAWPVIFGLMLYKFHEPIVNLIKSAQGRKFTIKVAGNELTMEEASEQQRKIVNDVQSRLAEIEKNIRSKTFENSTNNDSGKNISKSILWVDDSPKNNSFLMASLQERGHTVVVSLDTEDGLNKFNSRQFDIVISDMARPEGKKAGIYLAKQIRKVNEHVPFFIFCSSWAAKNLKDEARQSGVTDITSSGTTLLGLLPL